MIFLTAFGAGLMSFFSPCVLPLIPGYLSWISGFTVKEILENKRKNIKRDLLANSAFFILGFSLVFSLMGAAASQIGNLLSEYRETMLRSMGILLFFLGLHIAGFIKIKFLYYEKRFQMSRNSGFLGSFAIGLAFAAGWSPCIGPFLAGALALAAKEAYATKGIILLFVYSMGIAVPLLATALAAEKFLSWASGNRKLLIYLEKGAGVILSLFGILLFFDKFMFL